MAWRGCWVKLSSSWKRHDMVTLSALLALWPPLPVDSPTQRTSNTQLYLCCFLNMTSWHGYTFHITFSFSLSEWENLMLALWLQMSWRSCDVTMMLTQCFVENTSRYKSRSSMIWNYLERCDKVFLKRGGTYRLVRSPARRIHAGHWGWPQGALLGPYTPPKCSPLTDAAVLGVSTPVAAVALVRLGARSYIVAPNT